MNLDFYNGKTVLITGHTGFKGTWLTRILVNAGAKVIGYALEPNEYQELFKLAKVEDKIVHIIGDMRDYEHLSKVIKKYKPEIIFHLAAQPLVLDGYKYPRFTYETNVMGVVNLLDSIKESTSVKTLINITTDKVYQNPEDGKAFLETDRLNGYDPYANSKSCSELVTECYYRSFLKDNKVTVITMRAGNVIGGGDSTPNRIIPNCVEAAKNGEDIIIRNPNAVRPFQHVLEPLFAYLMAGTREFDEIKHYNVGPQKRNHVNIETLVKKFCKKWGNVNYVIKQDKNAFHEAELLYLDCHKIHKELGWRPVWNIDETISKICEFYKAKDIAKEMDNEINEYITNFNDR